jgi:hypothetical protein
MLRDPERALLSITTYQHAFSAENVPSLMRGSQAPNAENGPQIGHPGADGVYFMAMPVDPGLQKVAEGYPCVKYIR